MDIWNVVLDHTKKYAWLVDKIRKYQEKSMDLDSAIDRTIDEIPEDFLIKKFLVGNRAEVKMMLLTEYDEEKHIKMEREEAWEDGREEGRKLEMANTLKEKSRADALEKELSEALAHIKELESRLNKGV